MKTARCISTEGDCGTVVPTASLNADCDVYWIQTPTGPGGLSGPLRVDLEGKWTGGGRNVMREYSWHEAQAAFDRTAANHRQSGWGPPGR